ncbi:MAG: GAF domain-containing protein, partial [Actinomycetota bacterium]|nr:GAF domain-containing protein [Actinomycetota bacterium]
MKTRELEVIVGAGREFIERRGMGPDLLEAVLERGMDIIDADSGSLMMVRSGTDLLEVVAPRGGALQHARGEMVRLGEGIAGRVAESGRSVLISGVSDPVLEHSVHPGRGITTSVSVPLKQNGVVLGVINLNSSNPNHHLTGEDLLLVEQYALFAASVISNARLHEATERRMYELMQLSGIASALGVSADIDEVLSLTSSLVEKAFDFEIAGIVLTSWGRDHATIVLGRDVSSFDADAVLAEAAGRDVQAEPFESMRLVTHRGSLVDESECRDGWNVMSSEMVAHGSVVGFACIASCAEGAFDADDRRLLDGLAHHTAMALERAALFQRARDDLTRTITALSATLDATEHASPGHADRVMDYAMLIGEEMNLGFEQVELLRFAGLLHDVGKVGVSEEIL